MICRTASDGWAVCPVLHPPFARSLVYAERSTLENARLYNSGLVPTTVPKCSRITAADRKPASVATCSMARSVVSSSRCARRTRACASHTAASLPPARENGG